MIQFHATQAPIYIIMFNFASTLGISRSTLFETDVFSLLNRVDLVDVVNIIIRNYFDLCIHESMNCKTPHLTTLHLSALSGNRVAMAKLALIYRHQGNDTCRNYNASMRYHWLPANTYPLSRERAIYPDLARLYCKMGDCNQSLFYYDALLKLDGVSESKKEEHRKEIEIIKKAM
jgi:hypothetical protein